MAAEDGAADDQLCRDQEHDCGGDAEEFLQVDAHTAFDEHHAESNRGDEAEQGSQKAHQFGGVQADAGQDEHRLCAFTEDHQEDEDEEAEPGIVARQQADLTFDLALHLAAGLHHEDDHGDDEEGGDEFNPSFKDVFVQVGAGDDDGDADAA